MYFSVSVGPDGLQCGKSYKMLAQADVYSLYTVVAY